MKNYYDILEIKPGSTDEEIKKAYRRLAQIYHPDKNVEDPNSSWKFNEISEAYKTLSDPSRKKFYDTNFVVPQIPASKTQSRKFIIYAAALIIIFAAYFINRSFNSSSKKIQTPYQENNWNSKIWKKIEMKTGDVPKCYKFSPTYSFRSENKLQISTGIVSDAVIKLIDSTTHLCIRYVYLKFGSSFVISDLPNGNYYLKIYYGTDWREFANGAQCRQMFILNGKYTKSSYVFMLSGEHKDQITRVSLNPNLSMVNNEVYKEDTIGEDEWEK